MPIRRRQESRSGLYHVVVKGINKECIYNQQRERVYFKNIILKHIENHKVEIYAYCIMSNHAHFIIRAEVQELSMFMARILAEYASYYNYKHHRNGHVFQNRFLSECIESERYYWNCLRYIHLNPVKANIVKHSVRYKFSSMREYFSETTVLLHKIAIDMYKKHFADYEDFERFHRESQSDVFVDTRDEVLRQQVEFTLHIAIKLQKEKNKTMLKQVIEEKDIREEYIKRIQQNLKVSQKKSKDLYTIIKSKIEKE